MSVFSCMAIKNSADAIRITVLVIKSLVVISLVSACSQREMRTLQSDYIKQHETYSRYVNDHLKSASTAKLRTGLQTKLPNRNSAQSAKISNQLKVVQAKLLASKGQVGRRINLAIQQNGIFKPPQALQKTVNSLPNQTQHEHWLNAHTSLPAVLTLVLRNNLSIQARLQEAKTTLSRYDQVSFLDDTMAQYASFAGKPAAANFPFPGLLTLKGSIIDSAVESSRLNLVKTIQDVLTQARIAYYELQFAQQESRLVKKKGDLLLALKEQMRDSFESQNTDLELIVKVDVDIEKQRNRRQLAKLRQRSKQARLNALMNVSTDFKLGRLARQSESEPSLKKQMTSTEQVLIVTSKKHRVEIALLQTELKKVERIIQLSERRFYPDYSANYSRFQNRTINQVGSNATRATFSNSPSGTKGNFFGNKNAYLEETRQKYKALQGRLNALYKLTEDDVQRTFLQFQSQQSRYDLYLSQVIPKLKTALDIVKNQYETGGSTYLNVINTENMIIDARLSASEAFKNVHIEAAKLSRFVGWTH